MPQNATPASIADRAATDGGGTRPRLLVTRRLLPEVEAMVAARYRVAGTGDDTPLQGAALAAAASGCDGILIIGPSRLSAEVIAALPATVRIVATYSAGTDHIDLAAARARGILVSNTPDAVTEPTAELAMLLILAALRRAGEGERLVRAGLWEGWGPQHMIGGTADGRRLGIFGMGRIGRALARRAQAFGMQIHYCNRSRLPADLEAGAVFHATADDLLPVADVLSLNAPGGAETEHFLDARRIALLPEGAVVVNTARGSLVDDDALIAALRAGRVAAAGLDVFHREPALDPRYRTLDNVFLLPHLGSATREARLAMGAQCLANLDAFFAGADLPNKVA